MAPSRGTRGVESRSWRNRNPSNLRPPSSWTPQGVAGIDSLKPNGPFLIFASERDGWRAAATRILQLNARGIRTPRAIISIWAPRSDGNNTEKYVSGVAASLGTAPDAPVDVTRVPVMRVLLEAIRRHEGLPRDPPWDPAERDEGIREALKANAK